MTQSLLETRKRMSYAEYIERELTAEVRSEYHGGEVLEMTGGTIDHSRIIRNVAGELRTLLRGKPCESFESNRRLHIRELDQSVYPDAQVICGPIQFHGPDVSRTTVLNPTVVIEVLSPGTAAYDRGEKMRAYLSVPSLKQYVLIESTTAYAEILTRAEAGWLRTDAKGVESTLAIASIDVELKMSEVYLGVELPAPAVAS
jgi:Uma2 family endonuclease